MKKIEERIDANLIPTYEGGDPSRYCHPKGGYPTYAGTSIESNETGYSYDGVYLLSKKISEKFLYYGKVIREVSQSRLVRLEEDIDNRAKLYGK